MPDPVTLTAAGGVAGIAADRILPDVSDAILRDILAQLVATNRYADVQRRRTLYPINLTPTNPDHSIASQLRTEHLTISGAPGDEIALRVGTANLFSVINVSGDPVTIRAPMLLQGDISIIDITDPTATDWRATLWAWRDSGQGISTGDER